MNYKFSWAIQDGKLDYQTGRIIVFNNNALKSNGPSMDHNDLLRAFARKYKEDTNQVISNAIRLYWKPISKSLIQVSPVRKIDEDWVDRHQDKFNDIIKNLFK
jgi:hypothetical protein